MENIIYDLDLLSQPSEPLEFLTDTGVNADEGTDIINKLKEIMSTDESIIALAAPQIGINKRIFCLRFNDQIKSFINPIITKKRGINITVETCKSLPGKEIVIGRPEEVTVVYYNDEFKYEDNKLIGAAASMFDQQAQILDGVLPSELGLVSDVEVDGKIEDSDLAEIAQFYKDTFLPSRLAALKEMIDADDSAAKDYKHLKFTEGVINGRIAVVESDDCAKNAAAAKKAANKAIVGLNRAEKAEQKKNFSDFVRSVSRKSH